MDTSKSVGEIVRKMEQEYVYGTVNSSKYVDKSMYEDIAKIDAYVNSRHTSGLFDSLGREKPFFNISVSARNIWYRATDIDRKNIKVRATRAKHAIMAFLATQHLQEWMREASFGVFLNKWGLTLATYGSAVVKFVEKDGKLIPDVEDWNSLIVDPISFNDNPVVKMLELTPAQLRKRKGYDREMVERLIEAQSVRTQIDGQNKDNKSGYIKLYEIHGELPLSLLTGRPEDDEEYVQQMHVVSFVASKEKGNYDDYCLISAREDDPYMITHLIELDGQTLSIGAVQNLFEAQWMANHTAKAIKDQLDVASKLMFQSADESFVGQNALDAIESGDILTHKPNMPLTQVNNGSHDIGSLQAMQNSWKSLGNEINGISEAMLGINPPSGSAWRQTEALLTESYSLFELMTENKGLYIEEMLRRFVIPHIKRRKLSSNKEIAATLEASDMTRIDSMYIRNQANAKTNRKIIDMAIKGEVVTPEMQAQMTQQAASQVTQGLESSGGQRFFAPDEVDWVKEFKDFDWNSIEVDVTGESVDRDAVTTLNTLLATIGRNPAILQDPNMRLIVNKILMRTGEVSPVELTSQTSPVAQPVPVAA